MTHHLNRLTTSLENAKTNYQEARRKNVGSWKFLGILSIVLAILFAGATVFLSLFDNTIAAFVGGNFTRLINKDPDAIYFESDYENAGLLVAAGSSVCYQVELEGAALLKNENNALPLEAGVQVSTFSSSSVDLVYGGTGSGNVDASKADDLKTCLEASGLIVNPTLWNFYKTGEGSSYRRSSGSGESAVLAGHASIREVPASVFEKESNKEVYQSFAQFNDAAIVTFSRVGGEGYDCNFEGIADYNYLALNEDEKSMLKMVCENFDKVIVLLNTSNPLQLDFLNDYDVDAVLWVGGLGAKGTNAVADLLVNKKGANPSGSLVDTYLYDNYASPAMKNFKALTYQGDLTKIPSNATTYMVYQEGIYVGYKYFETRYEDYVLGQGNAGEYNYGAEVAYPFGYGQSYTEFAYSDYSVTDKGETVDVTVRVENVGEYDGMETIQIYSQAPYTQYDIDNNVEKASVNLVGFDKVFLRKGEAADVKITVDKRDIASYDAYGEKTYILEEGTYYLTAATDSHNAINNILASKDLTAEQKARMDGDGDASLVDTWEVTASDNTSFVSKSLNGTAITNQLDDADPNLYYNQNVVTFLSRNNWLSTLPVAEEGKTYADYKLMLNGHIVLELQEGRYENYPEYYAEQIAYMQTVTQSNWNVMPRLDQGRDLTLYNMIGNENYNDPAWKYYLQNLTINELVSIGDSFHWRMPVISVNAPGTRDENGPQGLTASLLSSDASKMDATAFTSEDVMAATFNKELIEKVGNIIGNDCLYAGVACLYGPGANTHRTPYGGRNFEYYSEDGFLAGEMGAAEVKGIQDKGVDVVMKHFALNDTEQDRLGQAAWITEQAAREIYLKAFQKSLEEAGGNGVMTAYTRWGTTWSGAHPGLMTNIMRREWGNQGMSITDNILVTYTNAVDAVIAGGVTCFDAMLWYATDSLQQAADAALNGGDAVPVNAMVEAMHHNLYALANSSGMNGIGKDTIVMRDQPIALSLCQVATIVFAVLAVISVIYWTIGNCKIREERLEVKRLKHCCRNEVDALKGMNTK